MATISITIPNAIAARVEAGLCLSGNYQATIAGAPNPETTTQFAKRMILAAIKEKVIMAESRAAAVAAAAAVTGMS